MPNPVIKKFETKSHGSPDEVRAPHKTRVEVIQLGGFTMGRFQFDPGWRWSECIKPVMNTDSCQVSHVGYAISGQLTVRTNDGTQKMISAGDSYRIPPGHDAWVEGNEPFISVELMSADQLTGM
jgi:quercetin dioxygenase-like cupin family protein